MDGPTFHVRKRLSNGLGNHADVGRSQNGVYSRYHGRLLHQKTLRIE